MEDCRNVQAACALGAALLGGDMSTDAGIKEAADKGLFESKCSVLVEASTREALRLMA
jgi:hypothetical protein